jgi:PmbA protein
MSLLSQEAERSTTLAAMSERAGDVIKRCLAGGASAAEVSVSQARGLNVSVRQQEIESLEFTHDRGLSIVVYAGKRRGSASSADWSADSIQASIEQALAIANHTEPDDCAGPADAELLAREFPDLELWHPSELEAEAAVTLAKRAEAAGLDYDPRISMSDGASVSAHRSFSVFASSFGFVGGEASTSSSLSCGLIAGKDQQMQREHYYDASLDARALKDPELIGRTAGERTLRRLGARALSTRTAQVLFHRETARSIFSHFASAISGGALYRRSSFLLDSVGKQVFPSWLRIHEQPHLRREFGSAAFDDEGVATQTSALVEGGKVARYILGSYSARKLGLRSTGNAGGTHNLTVDANADSLESMIKQMGSGLLVTEFLGQGINMVTGDYSRGAAGYWVENGELAFPVEEITIAGKLQDMFQAIEAVGADIDPRSSARVGSVLIGSMTIAGGSKDD